MVLSSELVKFIAGYKFDANKCRIRENKKGKSNETS